MLLRADVIVVTVASAAEELASSIREIGRQVDQSCRVSSAASEEANRTNATVHGLAQASARIGAVTQAAGKTGAAAGQVLSSAQSLSREALQLKAVVITFLQNVRVA